MKSKFSPACKLLLIASAIALLNACGSGSGDHADASTNSTASVTTLRLVPDSAVGQLVTEPTFHIAPVILEEPSDVDALDNAASARSAPIFHDVPNEFRALSTARLTLHKMELARQAQADAANNAVNPMAASGVITYTPAQIRAAYGLPQLPATGATLSTTQAAALGAGQTIYLIDAMNDPNVAAELATFNQKFGLPSCATTSIPATTHLPLVTASKSACQFSVVYSTAGGGMTSTVPAYDSGWATEIALDVQWSHATAPLARIILIEAANASTSGLIGAIELANAMGPGAVSMSFGTPEGNWTSSEDGAFTIANMSYLAATGDSGAGVGWPAVSTHVLAVGGTTLTYNGSGSRSETAWADTGGGVSAYVARPAYQSNSVPDMGTQSMRAVADVSFNANPNTGQYLAVMTPGSSSTSWLSAGGTSLATPQWAGIVAIANAQRALASKAALGAPHAALYGQIASVAGYYSSAFLDVKQGSDGSCATCSAHQGYDELTGLGTPNVASILNLLNGSTTTSPVTTPPGNGGTSGAPAPVHGLSVTASAMTGHAGHDLTGTITISDSSVAWVEVSISGVPAGMTLSANGLTITANWPNPVVGSTTMKVQAIDSAGSSTSLTIPITVTAK
jgi:subtilase family serine protease